MTGDNQFIFVSQRYPPDKGGNAARVHDIATHLQGQDCSVTVLAPPPCYPPGEFDRTWRRHRTDTIDGVTVHRLWTWQPQVENPGTARRLAYYLLFGIHAMLWLLWNVRQYDAVVTTTPPISTGAPGLLAKTLGKAWVVDVRDLWIDASISLGYLEAGSLLEQISRRFQQLVLQRADRIAVTTEALGESLFEAYGASLSEKTIHVPNGADTERFRPNDERKINTSGSGTGAAGSAGARVGTERGETATGANAKPDGGGPTIVYTGNLGSAQDLESCIRAISHLSHEGAVLQLVGSGDLKSELLQLSSRLGVEDRVEFVGVVPREEVPALLREATIGIAPLKDTEELAYAVPTKVYEYMASGLPTVVTGRGEIERFVRKSGGGICVENGPKRIAEQLDELLADDELRQRLADNGRDYVKSRHSRRAIAQELNAELTRLVENEPG